MTRIVLFGKNGQLGWELERTLPELGEVTSLGRSEADFEKTDELRQVLRDQNTDLIVNAVAYTDVDRAESERDRAMAVNAIAPGLLAQEARRIGALLIHYSTDYVFDGDSRTAYRESDPTNPINTYGRSKLAGEQAVRQASDRHLILRSSWVYSLRRDSFVSKVLQWAKANESLRVVDDQWGSPTWCRTLAIATTHALKSLAGDERRERYGLYHVACRGAPSRYELAKAVLDYAGADPRPVLERASTLEFPAPAARPQFSALDPSAFENAFNYVMPGWREELGRALSNQTS